MGKSKRTIIMLLLKLMLLANCATTIANIIAFANGFPVTLPVASFSALRALFVGILEKNYLYISTGVLIPLLLFLTVISVCKQKIIFSIVSLVYYFLEFLLVLKTTIDIRWITSTHVFAMMVSLIAIPLLCVYIYLHQTD